MSKRIKILLPIVVYIILLSVTTYILLANRYQNGFAYGIWVNGVYCTGKEVHQVDEELREQYVLPDFTIEVQSGAKYCIKAEDFDYEISFINTLGHINQSNHSSSVFMSDGYDQYDVEPEIRYSEDKLKQLISEIPEFKSEADKNKEPRGRLYIVKDNQGYTLVDYTKDILDIEAASNVIINCINQNQKDINLVDENCYYNETMTYKMSEIYQTFDKLNAFQNFAMVYLFGTDSETIDKSIVCNWILKDESGTLMMSEDGDYLLDESAVREYITVLANKYDTYGKERKYITYDGREVTIPGGTYGNLINQEIEYLFLLNALQERRGFEEHTPEYIETALYQGLDDIGENYIEIDLTAQKLYLILEKELYLETNIVSGNLKWKLGTPDMICYVNGKYRNRVLTGPGYSSPVSYWVPIYKNIGIHDARWRKSDEFGGEIYKTKGSHGCINIEKTIMPDIYDNIFIGMPVILYY